MKYFLLVLFFIPLSAISQIEITNPCSRAIYQRSNDNAAFLPIAGNFSVPIDQVEARMIPINGGKAVNWTLISINPTYGYFNGTLNVTGGWYSLEVRGLYKGKIVGTATLDKVGVGEVFLISGQSNAQGYYGFGNQSAQDDRVNCISNYFSASDNKEIPYAEISHLKEDTPIAPFGKGSWCWGSLGDLLVKRLNVPVLFINAAFEAMAIDEWRKSAEGGKGYNFYVDNYAEAGFPYKNLKKSLNFYINTFGVRTILWHQGESDSDLKTSAENYSSRLKDLISRSRIQSGKNLSWMISRVSLTRNGTFQPIIDAQNEVIRNTPNTFAGPNTDLITDRTDGVHFFGNSLLKLAEAWNGSLTNDFFKNSVPFGGVGTLPIGLECNQNQSSPLKISMPVGLQSYFWTDDADNLLSKNWSFETNRGLYRGRAADQFGNVFYTPKVRYLSNLFPEKPIITVEGENIICAGKSVRLSTTDTERLQWNTTAQTSSIIVSSEGTYQVKKTNQFGCSSSSLPVNIFVKTAAQPTIEPIGLFSLQAKNGSKTSDSTYQWFLNDKKLLNRSSKIKIKETGIYQVKGIETFALPNGKSLSCESVLSEPVEVKNIDLNARINIFPNPVTESTFQVETNEELNNATLQILTPDGKLLKTTNFDKLGSLLSINIEELPKGLLILRLTSGDFDYIKTFYHL